MNRPGRHLPFFLLLASASLFFLPLGARALWNSDEGRYAEIAREMLELKDWITPHLNYVLYFEKPPLVYWLTAASFALLGQNEFAARFWCAVFGVLTVGVTYLLGKHWKGERAGLLSGGILATSLLFFALTQFLVLDMVLTFWTTLALYASSRLLMERPPERVKRFAYLLAVAVAGGVLTKGLIGVVFPVVVLGLTIAYTRSWGQARKIPWQAALLFAIVLAAPWFVIISLKHPYFPYFFFIREHIERFLTTVHHREEPFYFFLPVVLGGFLPWSVYLPKMWISAFEHRGIAMKRDPVLALLVLWSLFVLIFFSCSQSKLVSYILPILPAMALCCGRAFDETWEEIEAPAWVERGLVGLILVHAAALGLLKLPLAAVLFQQPAVLAFRAHADALSLILGLIVFILVGVWGMRQSIASFGGVMITQVLLLSTLASLVANLDPFLSNKGLAHALILRAKPEERVVSYGVSYENVLQTLPFYSHRRIAVFGDPGELAMGRDQAPEEAEWFSEETTAAQSLAQMPAGTWVITNDEYLKGLSESGLNEDLEQITREGRLLLLHKMK